MSWYREVTADQRKAFAASFLGWVLDGFDATMLTFVLLDIRRTFAISAAEAGALGAAQAVLRIGGGIGAGTAADRWGRKPPLMLSILWFSVFAGLSGFASSYGMLLALRALFGVGMGGVWAAGMPLTIEQWPARLRGVVSGLLQGGFSVGFVLAAVVFHYVYPLVDGTGAGWRVMFWIGVLPALLVLWIMSSVRESPVWLARQNAQRGRAPEPFSVLRLFDRDLAAITMQTSLLIGAFMIAYQAMTFWYAPLLVSLHRDPLPYVTALNVSGIVGAAMWGRLSETALGRRGAFTLAMSVGLLATPLYLLSSHPVLLLLGASVIGLFAAGSLGIAPGYLAERFPTSARGAGAGFAYHVGAGIGAAAPYLVGLCQDWGLALAPVMSVFIVGAGLLMIGFVWLGPETRGQSLSTVDYRL